MALFKQVWTYFNARAKWSEVYYRNRPDLASAAIIPNVLITRRQGLLSGFTTIDKVRTSSILAPRASKVTSLNVTGDGFDNKAIVTPAFPEEAIVYRVYGTGVPGSRAITFRGQLEDATFRNDTNGNTELLPEFAAKAASFIRTLADNDYALLTYAKVGQPGIVAVRVIGVDGTTADGSSVVTTGGNHGFADGERIQFNQVSQKTLPGLKGAFTIGLLTPTTFRINYATPGNKLFLPNAGKVHKLSIIDTAILDRNNFFFSHTGSRQTKNEGSGSRGARRAPRSRALA